MPDDNLTPKGFDGATTWIRHNSTPAECEAGPNDRHKRRTVGLSVIPESDPHFGVYGKREDAESTFSDLKARLRYGRCNTIEYDNVMFMLLAYQLKTIVTSLIAYQKRTEADISSLVGTYQPRTRGSPPVLMAGLISDTRTATQLTRPRPPHQAQTSGQTPKLSQNPP